jgi:glucosamine--fructose-6-phosphate aminotransferase (isomerizing)
MTRVRRLGKVQMLAQARKNIRCTVVPVLPIPAGRRTANRLKATRIRMFEHIVVVHNGIIENHEPLRELLKARGYVFVSETDTEVIAHLVHWELEQGGTLRDAVLRLSRSCAALRYGDHGFPRSGHAAGRSFR